MHNSDNPIQKILRFNRRGRVTRPKIPGGETPPLRFI